MPLVSQVVRIDGGEYLDGAIADPIPLKWFENSGFCRNVVILTQQAGFRKPPQQMMWLLKIALRKYPAVVKVLAERHLHYNQTLQYIENEEKRGNIIILRPETALPVMRISHDPDALQQTYDIGKLAAKKSLEKIKEFLSGKM